MLTYLFPGQGSQSVGMGKDLFAAFPEYTAQADEILGYSIAELCRDDPQKQLNQTQYTQPALYVVNALSYLKSMEEGVDKADYVAGHSLGEYNALFAAEVFDFASGLRLVAKRGELMSQAQGGGMAAVIGLNAEELTAILAEHELTTVSIANYNSYQQLVITGPKEDVAAVASILSTLAIKNTVIPLSVSGAFHSVYMMQAQQVFAEFIQDFVFAVPKCPVISNVAATPYHPAVIKSNLVNQIVSPVEWTKTISYLQTKPGMTFKEIGPGTVLTGLLRRIERGM